MLTMAWSKRDPLQRLVPEQILCECRSTNARGSPGRVRRRLLRVVRGSPSAPKSYTYVTFGRPAEEHHGAGVLFVLGAFQLVEPGRCADAGRIDAIQMIPSQTEPDLEFARARVTNVTITNCTLRQNQRLRVLRARTSTGGSPTRSSTARPTRQMPATELAWVSRLG